MSENLQAAGDEQLPKPEGERCDKRCEPMVSGQVARAAIEIVEKIQNSFLQSVQAALSELLQIPITMSLEAVTQSPLASALNVIGPNDRAIVFDLSPVRGCAYLTFPAPLLFRVLDILLATSGAASDPPGRPVTGIELHILQEFFNVFAALLRASWAPLYPAAFKQIPMLPADAEMAGSECGGDLALTLRTSISLVGTTADIYLVIPAFLARLVELKAKAVAHPELKPVRETTLNYLADANLRLEAVLRGASIRIRDLLELNPGQILLLNGSNDSAFDCLVNGKNLFTGDLLATNGRCGIQIEKLIGAVEINS